MGRFKSYRNQSETISFQIDKRTIGIVLALFLISCLSIVFGLSSGSSFIDPISVALHVLGFGSGEHDFVIGTLRLPRVILAFLVGAGLGVSGLLLQGIVRNPLASPDIIGITGGAAVGAVFFIVTFSGMASVKWVALAAFLGAAIVSTIMYILSWKNGVTPIRLVLIGIGMAAATNALTMMMIVLSDIASANEAYRWLTGSLYGADWMDVKTILPWLIIFIPLGFLLSRTINAKELGDDVAISFGINVQAKRFILLLSSVALAGAAVATAGGIGFVGLIAPHLSRMLIGRSFASLIPASAMLGGIIVVLADLVARTAFLPLDIPAGVFTAGIGAPFFIYLLFRNRNL